MDRAEHRVVREAIISNGWSAVGKTVVASATLAVLGAAFWFGDWRATVNHRFDDQAREIRETKREIREVKDEIGEMRGEMREMREENRMIQESLARIEQRLTE